jgi:four helix bundle protein
MYNKLDMQNYEAGGDKKIKSFTNLNAHKEAHKLVLLIYKITKEFPKEERFCLIDQIRRAAVSITSNIAEGFSRNTNKDKCQFYALALGSLSELQSQLLIARDLGYLTNQTFNQIAKQSIIVRKLISGLKRIKYQNEKT